MANTFNSYFSTGASSSDPSTKRDQKATNFDFYKVDLNSQFPTNFIQSNSLNIDTLNDEELDLEISQLKADLELKKIYNEKTKRPDYLIDDRSTTTKDCTARSVFDLNDLPTTNQLNSSSSPYNIANTTINDFSFKRAFDLSTRETSANNFRDLTNHRSNFQPATNKTAQSKTSLERFKMQMKSPPSLNVSVEDDEQEKEIIEEGELEPEDDLIKPSFNASSIGNDEQEKEIIEEGELEPEDDLIEPSFNASSIGNHQKNANPYPETTIDERIDRMFTPGINQFQVNNALKPSLINQAHRPIYADRSNLFGLPNTVSSTRINNSPAGNLGIVQPKDGQLFNSKVQVNNNLDLKKLVDQSGKSHHFKKQNELNQLDSKSVETLQGNKVCNNIFLKPVSYVRNNLMFNLVNDKSMSQDGMKNFNNAYNFRYLNKKGKENRPKRSNRSLNGDIFQDSVNEKLETKLEYDGLFKAVDIKDQLDSNNKSLFECDELLNDKEMNDILGVNNESAAGLIDSLTSSFGDDDLLFDNYKEPKAVSLNSSFNFTFNNR